MQPQALYPPYEGAGSSSNSGGVAKNKKGPDGSSSCLERLVGFRPHFRLPLERRAGGYGRADHQDRREAGRLFHQLDHEGNSRPHVLHTPVDPVEGGGREGVVVTAVRRREESEARSSEATSVERDEDGQYRLILSYHQYRFMLTFVTILLIGTWYRTKYHPYRIPGNYYK